MFDSQIMLQERLAAEVAALDRSKPTGASKSRKDATAVSASMQTDCGVPDTACIAASNAGRATLQNIGMQTDSSSTAAAMQDGSVQTGSSLCIADMLCSSMQTDPDPLLIDLSSARNQLERHNSELCKSKQVTEQFQGERCLLEQQLACSKAEVHSLTEQLHSVKAFHLSLTAVLKDRSAGLHEQQQHCKELALDFKGLEQQQLVEVSSQLLQKAARYQQQAEEATAAAASKSAELLALQQRVSQLDNLSTELSAAQERLAQFENACCTLWNQTVNLSATSGSDTACHMLPDGLVELGERLKQETTAMKAQMMEQVGRQVKELQTVHSAEMQQLRYDRYSACCKMQRLIPLADMTSPCCHTVDDDASTPH